MFTKTINHTIATSAEELSERAEPWLDKIRQDAADEAARFRTQVADSIELGSWVIGGAILIGFVLTAVFFRVGD